MTYEISLTAGDTTFRASSFAPFGSNCIILRDAWCTDYGRETPKDARTIIIPSPVTGERMDIREVQQ